MVYNPYRHYSPSQLKAIEESYRLKNLKKDMEEYEKQRMKDWLLQQREYDKIDWENKHIHISTGETLSTYTNHHTFKYSNSLWEDSQQDIFSRTNIFSKYFKEEYIKAKRQNKIITQEDYMNLRLLTISDLIKNIEKNKNKNIPNRNALRSIYYFLSRLYEEDRDRELGMFRMTINLKDDILLSDMGLGLTELKKINEKFNLIRKKNSYIDNIIIGYYLNYELSHREKWHMHYSIFTDNRPMYDWNETDTDIPFIMNRKMIDIVEYWYRLAGRVLENIRGEKSEKDIKKVGEKGREWIVINYSLPKYPLKYRYIDCLEDRNDQLDYLKYQCGMNKRTYDFKMENPNILLRTMSIR